MKKKTTVRIMFLVTSKKPTLLYLRTIAPITPSIEQASSRATADLPDPENPPIATHDFLVDEIS